MKDYRQLIKELPSKTVVMAFGRFNPPTIGHELLVKAVKKLAQQKNADHVIYASRSQDAKKNPLSVDKKVKYLNLMFRNTHFAAANEHVRTFIEAAKELNKKYKNIIMVAGSDRVPEFKRLLTTYNGKEFNYDTIEVISAGERDPDADDATGMSASKMRAIAVKGNYIEFKKGLPSTVRDIDGRRLMNDIREGMGLEPIKEQIILVKDDLREKYFRGEIFNEGDIVESNGEKYTIIKRGSNHLLLKENSGALVSKWIQDVQPTEEKDMNESLTDKTLKPNDKLKVARIIATMLGVENAETTSNPENLINNALRKVRTKALNPEALHILDKMLNLATEQGIDYDSSLKPSKLKEGVTQTNGTDKISVTTDSPVVDKNSNYNIAKDILRFNDFKKLKKVQEQHKGGESQADHKKDNESDIDADFDSHKADKKEVGHTLVSAGGQDNLRRRKVKYHLGEQQIDTGMEVAQKIMKKGMTTYGKEGGHELTAQHIATNPEHSGKQKKLAQSFISKMHGSVAEQVDLSEAAPFKTKEDAVKYAKEKVKTHRDKLDGIEIHAHSGGFDVNHTSNSSGRNSLQKIGAKHVGTIYKEEVQLGEATVKTQKYSWGTMKTVHHGADFSIPLHPEHHQAIAKLKDEQEHKFKTEDGKHWTARRKGDEVHFQGANNGGSTKVKHTDLKEEVQICETADAGLAAKAEKSGVSIGTLRKVYKRGVAAWNSGHRPGTTPQQWGMARVNSYITKGKGTYHGADKDLREEQELEESVKIVDRDSDLDQEHFKLHVNGKHEHFVHHNYENGHATDSKEDIHHQVKTQLKHLSPQHQIAVTNAVHSSYKIKESKLPEVPKDKESGLPKKYVAGLSDATAKARASHWDKMDKKSDSDPSAYEPAPGDATAKTKPSKHTLKYRAMFGEDMNEELYEACWDTHKQVGMKKKGDRMVPDCVPKNVKEATSVDVSKVNHAGDEPHDEEWEETGICPVCSDKECECQTSSQPLSTPSEKPFDPFFKEEEDGEVPELSDDEIEKMADGLTDDDYLDLYDEDEVGIIDDETGEELPENEEEEKKLDEAALMEVLSRMERIKAKARIRRTASKRERATKIALKRYSDTKTVNKRARRLAIKLMKKRLVRGRDPSKLSVGEKERIERMIEKRKAIIGRVAMRLVSRVRKVEKARLSHSKYTKGSPNVAF